LTTARLGGELASSAAPLGKWLSSSAALDVHTRRGSRKSDY